MFPDDFLNFNLTSFSIAYFYFTFLFLHRLTTYYLNLLLLILLQQRIAKTWYYHIRTQSKCMHQNTFPWYCHCFHMCATFILFCANWRKSTQLSPILVTVYQALTNIGQSLQDPRQILGESWVDFHPPTLWTFANWRRAGTRDLQDSPESRKTLFVPKIFRDGLFRISTFWKNSERDKPDSGRVNVSRRSLYRKPQKIRLINIVFKLQANFY
jgi:hypothetical protein